LCVYVIQTTEGTGDSDIVWDVSDWQRRRHLFRSWRRRFRQPTSNVLLLFLMPSCSSYTCIAALRVKTKYILMYMVYRAC